MFATRRKEAKAVDRVILHIDMNNFYASVETLYDPSLKDIPMAVGGDKERRHGHCPREKYARRRPKASKRRKPCGKRTQMPRHQVRPAAFERYAKYSRLAKEIYMQYTDMVESFGLDECWLDVTGSRLLVRQRPARLRRKFARRVKDELGLTVSIGVSFNKIFAKLGATIKSRMP